MAPRIDQYMGDLSRLPPHTEVDATTAPPEKRVEGNTRLVVHIAHKVHGRSSGLSFEDLVAEGNEALFRAAKGYDPVGHPGVPFGSYAGVAISRAMRRAQQVETVKGNPTRHAVPLGKWVPPGRGDSPVPLEETLADSGPEAGPAVGGEGSYLIADPPLTPEQALLIAERRRALEEALGKLDPRQREVLELRFMEDRTLKHTGEILGLSPKRIHQIQNQALRKLRHPDLCRRLRDYLED